MINTPELDVMYETIMEAKTPESLFGKNIDQSGIDDTYRLLVRLIHPDKYYNDPVAFDRAQMAFKRLGELKSAAENKLKRGNYGIFDEIKISSRKRVYTLDNLIYEDEISNLYHGYYVEDSDEKPIIMRIPFDPADNDLIKNEATALKKMAGTDTVHDFLPFVSHLIETFAYKDTTTKKIRNVNVFSYTEGMYTLREVHEAYPKGIDPKDAAWIWKRLLLAIGVAHESGIVHGSVVPDNISIHPEYHGLILFNWAYSGNTGEKIKATLDGWSYWYPKNLEAKPSLDIAMAARTMIYLLGGNPQKGEMPASVPKGFRAFFRGCLLEGGLSATAWELIGEFGEIAEKIYGPRKFHHFTMDHYKRKEV